MSLQRPEAIFAVRIVSCDYYLSNPIEHLDSTTSEFRRGSKIKQSPIVRIFGSTPAGQKCCLHVHGYFPYFCVPSPVSSPSDEFLRQLADAIDAALNSSFDQGTTKDQQQRNGKKIDRQYVHVVETFRAIPFYGYHADDALFLKISFNNPMVMKRAGEILQSGAIMNLSLQPHELHVPYEQKFMIDHDLYGMDYLSAKEIKFRYSGIPETRNKRQSIIEPSNLSQRVWNVGQLDGNFRLPPDVPRTSTCELEADCLAMDIVRAKGDGSSGVQNPGLKFIWKDEIERRKVLKIENAPTIPMSQDRPPLGRLPNEVMQFETLAGILNEKRRLAEETLSASIDLNASENAASFNASVGNLSFGSEHSFFGVLEDLADTETGGAGVRVDNRFGEAGNIGDDRENSDEENGDGEEEQDEAREEFEMTQRIEQLVGLDEEAETEDKSFRIDQVDGPIGDSGEAAEVIDISSDSEVDGNEMDRSIMNGIEVRPGNTSEPSVAPPASTSVCDIESIVSNRVEPMDRPTVMSKTVLTSVRKPPSRKQMIEWLADPANKRVRKRSPPRLPTSSIPNRQSNDIDAVDIEEIQARLSPDESIVSDSMSVANESHHVVREQPARISKTPSTVRTSIASRRGSEDSTIVLSSSRRTRPRVTSKGATATARKLSYPRRSVDDLDSTASSFDVTIASAHDIELLDRTMKAATAGKEKPKRIQAKKFTLMRRRESKGEPVTPKVLKNRRKSMSKPKKLKRKNVSELDAPSVMDSFGFDSTELNLAGAQITQGAPCLTIMTMELHVHTRHDLRPDPEFDTIGAIFYAFQIDNATGQHLIKGSIMICESEDEQKRMIALKPFDRFLCKTVESELALFDSLVEIIKRYDPDVLIGYEVQLLSWGFVFERAQFVGVDLCSKVSRIPDAPRQSRFSTKDDWWSMADIHVAGRIVLNLSKIMRHEVTLYLYTFENVVFNALHQRIPSYDYRTLTQWFVSLQTRWRVFEYYLYRVATQIELINHCDILNRSSELARLYGIQLYEVFSRGSQFRVESMVLRMSRTRNYVALSPSVKQRNRMAAPECIALTMEPESRFYTDPVLVLDFQSLYPSMMIAYNYCYSTCLGKIRNYARGDVFEFGCYKLKITDDLLNELNDEVAIAPSGVAFVTSKVRRGILPQMLEEILNTRVMVKSSAKLYKEDKQLQKILDARQLGLKLIANVTYGYTAASFSGRMPCIEIADSIVQKGRETLLRAVELVKNNEAKWNARVVYGDTDSLFVHLPRCSKEEAFRIGQEIVDAVTADNPKPIKLKFEKVFYPCVLQTKKRYVGYAYETLDQKEPLFDAKGIETVRRDVCPAVAKILQKSLETLFVSKQPSTVRQYAIRQFQRIHHGRVSPLDFILTRKYRGREHYKPDAVAPALLIAKRRLQRDRRAEPRIKERVPYVIVNGHPGSTLISCVREPLEFVLTRGVRLNYKYYVTKQICPALNRIFNIIGVDSLEWYASMPRSDRNLYGFGSKVHQQPQAIGNQARMRGVQNLITLSQFFQITECPVCRSATTSESSFCLECSTDPQASMIEIQDRIRRLERRRDFAYQLCNTCSMWRSTTGTCDRSSRSIECVSTVCPITYKRVEMDQDLQNATELRTILRSYKSE